MEADIKPKVSLLIAQFLRFAIIGGINTGIDFLILNLLMALTGIREGNGLIPLNVVSFTVAVINSYVLNKRWAFKDQASGDTAKKFTSFLVISVIGALINTAIVRIGSTNIDPMFGLSQTLWVNVAKIAATGASLIWNFIGYKLFVFKK
ncbi:MAG: GtrA family protein [Candidatus Doudnabacteria bacterium]|nr:GtrA family protein [Candidatus Doudnabacteria bacterium]